MAMFTDPAKRPDASAPVSRRETDQSAGQLRLAPSTIPPESSMSNITKQFNDTPITFNDEGWFNATEAAKGAIAGLPVND